MIKWVALAVGTALALALGTVLVPSGLEQSFMLLHDREYVEAHSSFRKRWDEGDRSRGVANALSELYLRLGDADAATSVLIEFVNANPGDREALERLATMFRDTQRRDRYIATLERLWARRHESQVLRTLDSLYEFAGREDDRVRALSTLVQSRGTILADHVNLADLLTARAPDRALEVLFNAFRRWPRQITADILQTFVALAADRNRDDLVRTVVVRWIRTRVDPALPAAAAAALDVRRRNGLALDVVRASGALSRGDAATAVLAARLELRAGQPMQALQRLHTLYRRGGLPAAGSDAYVEAAFSVKRPDMALDLIRRRGPEGLPFWMQGWVIGRAAEGGNRVFLEGIRDIAAVGTDASAARAHMLGRVHLAWGNTTVAAAQGRLAAGLVDTPAGAIAVASLLASAGDMDQARALFDAKVPPPPSVLPDDLAPGVETAIQVREGERALAMAQLLQAARPGDASDILLARALTAAGRGGEALALLDSLPAESEARELATFEALRATGQMAELQQRLTSRMNDDDATLAQRTNYTFMLNDMKPLFVSVVREAADELDDDLDDDAVNGAARLARIELLGKLDVARARPHAQAAATDDPDLASHIYIALLRQSGDRAGLVAYVSAAMPRAREARTQDSLLYTWLEAGVTPPALPWLKARAETGARPWFFAYAEALAKLGERAERTRFLTAYAARDDVDREMKAQIAHDLLDAGAKPDSLDLFRQQADDAPAGSPVIEQLLHLWGPRPPAEGLAWLDRRARSAPPGDRVFWLRKLVESGAARQAADIAAPLVAGGERAAAPALAQALVLLRRDAELSALLADELASGKTAPADAAALGQAAEDRQLHAMAARLFRMAADADGRYTASAARTAWLAGDKAEALKLLEAASARDDVSAGTVLLHAEALRWKRWDNAAKAAYARALGMTQDRTGREDRRIRMLALVRLGRLDEADRMMGDGSNADLRADYASALLDSGKLDRAAQILDAAQAR